MRDQWRGWTPEFINYNMYSARAIRAFRGLWVAATGRLAALEEAVPAEPPMLYPLPAEHLRLAAARLAAQLEAAKLYQAAAYVSMAVDAMATDRRRGANDDRSRADAECAFELDDYDRVWMHLDGDCQIIGRKEHLRTEMWRFLRTMLSKRF